MADQQSTQSPPKLTGIRRWKSGWQAYIEVDGRTYSKSFPIETSTKAMRAWRQDTKAGLSRHAERAALDAKRLPRSLTGWCYVYFAQSGDAVKIGRAVDPSERLRAIQTGQSGEVAIVACVAAHVALEAAIHKRFAHLRTRAKGEWFRLDPDLVAFISLIQQGANPVALLFEDPRVVLAWHRRPPVAAVHPDGAEA